MRTDKGPTFEYQDRKEKAKAMVSKGELTTPANPKSYIVQIMSI